MAVNDQNDVQSYFREGVVWEKDIVRSAKRSRALAWTMTFIMTGISFLLLVTMLSMFPLQRFEPYLVLIDRNTGFTDVRSGLTSTGDITELDAVTQANLVRFVRARESYDPFRIDENFGLAAILSAEDAARDLQEEFGAGNINNPARRYGANTEVLVEIASVSIRSDTSASVRFSTVERTDTRSITRNWVAFIRYRYTSTPQTNEWRFENPLGFQVVSYRRDQETVSPAS